MERVEDHIGLASWAVRRYKPHVRHVEDTEEYAEALLAIHMAAQDYDPDDPRGASFATLARTYACWAITNLYSKRKEFEDGVGRLDQFVDGVPVGPQTSTMEAEEPSFFHERKEVELARVLRAAHRLPVNQRDVILKTLEGFTNKEICAEMGLSRQRTSFLRKEAEINLKRILGVN